MQIWDFIYNHLSAKENVILIVVIDTKDSSPGRIGFKMAVTDKGEFAGSIGGGIMEHNMVELARKMLRENFTGTAVKRQVHNPESEHDRSGMICAGEQTQVFIALGKNNLQVISEIKQCAQSGEMGIVSISLKGLHFTKDNTIESQTTSSYTNQTDWQYYEKTGLTDTVYIFGGGHISLPLSQILRMLNFRVVVFDDRKELTTMETNAFAHSKEIINYKNIGHLVPDGPFSYVVIMSFGHKSDDVILRQMLPKKLKYLGMIGSKSKVGELFDRLRSEGFPEERLACVNSPIGIPIGSQTPVEIAVSIAAKIIEVRNDKSKV